MKSKIILSLLSYSDKIYFDTSYLVILYDSSFFQAQVPNTPISKMAIPIIVRGLKANKHATDQYTINNIHILTKNSQKKLVIVYI